MFFHRSSRKVLLPTCTSDMKATCAVESVTSIPELNGTSGRISSFRISFRSRRDILPTTPMTSSCRTESLATLLSLGTMTVIRPVSSSSSMIFSPERVSRTSLTIPMTLTSSACSLLGSMALWMDMAPIISRLRSSSALRLAKRSWK